MVYGERHALDVSLIGLLLATKALDGNDVGPLFQAPYLALFEVGLRRGLRPSVMDVVVSSNNPSGGHECSTGRPRYQWATEDVVLHLRRFFRIWLPYREGLADSVDTEHIFSPQWSVKNG